MTGRLRDNPVAPTSLWMAAVRAREGEREDRLFYDPLAADLAGPEGFAWLDRMETSTRPGGPGLYAVIRTRFFDDFLLDACRGSGVCQVVLAAAGMDTRAFRLDWPPQTRLFEMDLPEVLGAKDRVIESSGTEERCERRTVAVDLEQEDWPGTLLAAGYDAKRPSAWLVEGLLFYLGGTDVRGLLGKISALATPGSLLGLDVMNRNMLLSPGAWPQLAALARRGAGTLWDQRPRSAPGPPRLDGRRNAARRGGADFGRWTGPAIPRRLPGIPRSFLVRARRPGAPEPSR